MRRRTLLRGLTAAGVGGGAAQAGDTAPVTVERDSAAPSEYGAVGGSGSVTIETGTE